MAPVAASNRMLACGHFQEHDGDGELEREAGGDRRRDVTGRERAPTLARLPDQQRDQDDSQQTLRNEKE